MDVDVDGVWYEDLEVVRSRRLFAKQFSKPPNYKVRLRNVDFLNLTQEVNIKLIAKTEEEVSDIG